MPQSFFIPIKTQKVKIAHDSALCVAYDPLDCPLGKTLQKFLLPHFSSGRSGQDALSQGQNRYGNRLPLRPSLVGVTV